MPHPDRANARSQPSPRERPSPNRPRLLVLETDPLTLWSLTKYLARWFTVDATSSPPAAARLLRKHPVEAIVVTDQVPRSQTEALVRAAHRNHPDVRAVLLTAEDADHRPAPPGALRIEKPFALADVARLLGIPDSDLAA